MLHEAGSSRGSRQRRAGKILLADHRGVLAPVLGRQRCRQRDRECGALVVVVDAGLGLDAGARHEVRDQVGVVDHSGVHRCAHPAQ